MFLNVVLGKQMELRGEEWVCPNCKGTENSSKVSSPIKTPEKKHEENKRSVKPISTIIPVFGASNELNADEVGFSQFKKFF